MENYVEEFDYRVLIVEAEHRVAQNIKYVLDGLYKTDLVYSVEDAIKYLNIENYPNLILSNTSFESANDYFHNLEKGDGLSLLKFIQQSSDEKINNIPLMFVTKEDDSRYISTLFHEGAVDVITAPFDMLDLFSRIETRIEKASERKKLSESFQNLLDDMKSRNKKNLDFRSQVFAKHKESISKYESKVTKLRELLIDRNQEIEHLKEKVAKLSAEKSEIEGDLRELKIRIASSQRIEENINASMDNISESNLEVVERVFNYLNKEYLFEEELIKHISGNILASEIDFTKIDNFFLINNVMKIIKKHVKVEILRVTEDAASSKFKEQLIRYIDGVLEYIAKQYSHKFLFFFAVRLLELVGTKDENAVRFLRFYDGRIEIGPNGVRFQKPMISEGKENSWNMVTMIQIINQRTNGYSIIKEQEEKIKSFNDRIERIVARLKDLIAKDKSMFKGKLESIKSPAEMLQVAEEVYLEKKSSDNSDKANIEMKLSKISGLKLEYEKLKSSKETVVSKYAKQVAYYKPTEEKFAKVALSVAKIMLKVKVV
jgi:DNA-binding response OmpR family regulator